MNFLIFLKTSKWLDLLLQGLTAYQWLKIVKRLSWTAKGPRHFQGSSRPKYLGLAGLAFLPLEASPLNTARGSGGAL